jgi:predicted molibdopterin-dependent oxidoreductase YjgC
MINFEGRIQKIRKITAPLGNSKPDWSICSRIARKMGASGFDYRKAVDVFSEMTKYIPSLKGLSLGKLGGKGIRLNADKAKRKASGFLPLKGGDEESHPVRGYPLRWMGGWSVKGYRTASFEKSIAGMNPIASLSRIEIHTEDAGKLGIASGEPVRMKSNDGILVDGIANVTDRVPKKSVYCHGFRNERFASNVQYGSHRWVKIEKGNS